MRISERLLVTPTLLKRFEQEAIYENGDNRYFALIQRDNGDWLSHYPPHTKSVDSAQMIWATDVLKVLNRELHHDGGWVVVFTDPMPAQLLSIIHDPKHCFYQRYALIWVDADGDPQFTQDWLMGSTSDYGKWSDVVAAGPISTAQKCEAAWELWHHHMRRVLDPKPGELIKRAQGQGRA